jgi:hypothetical protein
MSRPLLWAKSACPCALPCPCAGAAAAVAAEQNLAEKLAKKSPVLYLQFLRGLCRLVDYTKTTKEEAKVVVKHDLYRVFKKCGLSPNEYPVLGLVNVTNPMVLYNWLELLANMWFYIPHDLVTNEVTEVAEVAALEPLDITPMFELTMLAMAQKPCRLNVCNAAAIATLNMLSAMNHANHKLFLPAAVSGRVSMLRVAKTMVEYFCAYYDCPNCSAHSPERIVSLAMYCSGILATMGDLLKVPSLAKELCLVLNNVVMDNFHMIEPILTTLHEALKLPVACPSRADAQDGLTSIIRCFAMSMMFVKTTNKAANAAHNDKFVNVLYNTGVMDLLLHYQEALGTNMSENALIALYMLLSQFFATSLRHKLLLRPLVPLMAQTTHKPLSAYWLLRLFEQHFKTVAVATDSDGDSGGEMAVMLDIVLKELPRHSHTTDIGSDEFRVWSQGLKTLLVCVPALTGENYTLATKTQIQHCLSLLPIVAATATLVAQIEHCLAHKPLFTRPITAIVPLYVVKKCAFCHYISPRLLLCSGCKMVRYCDTTCQRDDWARHKPECRAACAAKEAQRQAQLQQQERDNAGDIATTAAAATAAAMEADPTNND